MRACSTASRELLLDTNVLVAAFVARGVCSDLLEHCIRHHTVISSRLLLDELGDVLTRKFHQRALDARAATAIRLLAERFTLVTPDALESPVCRDGADDVVLATRQIRIYWSWILFTASESWRRQHSGNGNLSTTAL